MDAGTFSISLAVKDIAVSLKFYRKLGFTVIDGDQHDPDYKPNPKVID